MPTRRARRARQDQDLEELHQTILSASEVHSATSTPEARVAESTQIGMGDLVEALKGIAGQNRRCFKAPQFEGQGDVDLFISQFKDVAEANGWTDQESVLHLRSSLGGRALECGRGKTSEEIFTELCLQFGMSTKQARERLRKFQRSSKQSLREVGSEIVTLVAKAYPKLDSEDQEDMAVDTFVKSLDSRDLRRLLVVKPPGNIQEAIQIAEDFLQVGGENKPHKVTALGEVTKLEEQVEQPSEVAALLTQTLATMQQMPELQTVTLGELKNSRQQVAKVKKALACYNCGGPHLKKSCPQLAGSAQPSGNEAGPAQPGAQLGLDQGK